MTVGVYLATAARQPRSASGAAEAADASARAATVAARCQAAEETAALEEQAAPRRRRAHAAATASVVAAAPAAASVPARAPEPFVGDPAPGALGLGSSATRREVVCADAVEWLGRPGAVPPGALVLTSLPDESEVREFAPTVEAWASWFVGATRAVLEALPEKSLAVFYQTDVRLPGRGQISKSFLVLLAASEVPGVSLLWHKVVHFGVQDKPSHGSVRFTHLLCFYRRPDGESASNCKLPDTGGKIPDLVFRGHKPWGLKNSARCMGVNATSAVLKWASQCLPGIDCVVDPFCGAGTVLAIGNALGLHAVGVDISPRRVKQAIALDGPALLVGPPARGVGAEGDAEEASEGEAPALGANRGRGPRLPRWGRRP